MPEAITYRLAQERRLRTELPGPRSAVLTARRVNRMWLPTLSEGRGE